ncbi:MAG: ABC transporter [Planctomycetes bacterium]|nr:ABC transporter [Planctomycetota bacterium]
MATYIIEKQFPGQGPLQETAVRVCRMFGLTIDRLTEGVPVHTCRVEIRPGDIVFITGPSGSGKSVLLRELQRCVPPADAIDAASIPLPEDQAVVDCFAGDLVTSLRLLNGVGLGDVFTMLNRPDRLSAGQKHRFRLARALAAGKSFVFADEFCSELDRVTAATVAFNAQRRARQTQTTLLAASCRDDILPDLAPDVVIAKDSTGPAQVIYPTRR